MDWETPVACKNWDCGIHHFAHVILHENKHPYFNLILKVYSIFVGFLTVSTMYQAPYYARENRSKMAGCCRDCPNNSQSTEKPIWLQEIPLLFPVPNGAVLSCWQSTTKSVMAAFQLSPLRDWPSTFPLWLVSLIRTETGNFVRFKGSFGLRLTLIFIQFQSRTYPRNLLSQFQHYGEDNEGKSFLILS